MAMTTARRKAPNFDRDGKHTSWLEVSVGRGKQPVRLPVTIVRKGAGPSVLFTGGNHGDEYEGPVALMKLARDLDADDLVGGTVVIMPMLNPPAIAAGTRTSPIDGKNLNRVFPGDPKGSPTERIAHLVTSEILPHVETVYDLHAGGRASVIIPSVMIHKLRSTRLMARTVAAMKAFRAPVGIVIKEFESDGMIDTTVEKLGKVFGCCELGGAGMLTPETVGVTETGIRNLMIHLGIMKGRLRAPTWQGRKQSIVLEALSYGQYVHAEAPGIYEPFVDLAAKVDKGQVIGQIHNPKAPGRSPAVCTAPATGIVFARHAFGLIARGQQVALIAEESRRW